MIPPKARARRLFSLSESSPPVGHVRSSTIFHRAPIRSVSRSSMANDFAVSTSWSPPSSLVRSSGIGPSLPDGIGPVSVPSRAERPVTAGAAREPTDAGGRSGCVRPAGRAWPGPRCASRLAARVFTGPRVESRCTVASPSARCHGPRGQPHALGPLVRHDVDGAGQQPVAGHEDMFVGPGQLGAPPQTGPGRRPAAAGDRGEWRRGRPRRAASRRAPGRSRGR